jgi:hypothetical protein
VGYEATLEEEREGEFLMKSSRKVIIDMNVHFLGYLGPKTQ